MSLRQSWEIARLRSERDALAVLCCALIRLIRMMHDG